MHLDKQWPACNMFSLVNVFLCFVELCLVMVHEKFSHTRVAGYNNSAQLAGWQMPALHAVPGIREGPPTQYNVRCL